MVMKPSEKIAAFVCESDVGNHNAEVRERVKASIMDYVGVTIAGAFEESSKIVRRVIEKMGGDPQATAWGTPLRTSMINAALANGTAAHALDYDDSNSVMRSHPSAQLLPGLFAIGEFKRRSGKEIIRAYATGFEVGAKLGRALNPEMVFQGWLPVGVLGILMQTIACAKLMRLDFSKVQMALGIATNLSSGLRCNNGTMAKHLLAGQVGANGVMAALLASEGMNSNPRALEDRFGFFENFSGKDPAALQQAIDSLGEPLDLLESGITHKLYPCCTGTHKAIECALEVFREHPVAPEAIEKIEVAVSAHARPLLIYPRPRNEMEAKFSLEYCVSRALLDRQMGIGQFTPEKIHDPLVRSLIEKVNPTYIEILEYQRDWEWTRFPAEIQVHLKNGVVHSARVEKARGTPGNPLTIIELEERFRQCCRGRLSDRRVEQVLDALRDFEKISVVSLLPNLLY